MVLCNFLFVVFISFLLIDCRKGKSNTEIKEITGYTWQVGPIQETNDYYIHPNPSSWELKLNNDRSFSFNLNGSSCTGTYSWTAIDSISANVNFTIKKWPAEYSTANKLKNVLQGVTKCNYFKGSYIPPVMSTFGNFAMVLEFEGSTGYFYVHR